jgi:glycosyltransferase involved in cell wall biosynthesis
LNKKEIILINQVCGPMFVDIANQFIKSNLKVTLLTGEIQFTHSLLDEEVQVIRLKSYNRENTFYRLLTWIIFTIQSFFFLSFKKKYSRVLFCSNPPFLPLLVSLIKKKNLQIEILIYDIYPDILLNFGYISKKSMLYKLWLSFNKKSFETAYRIIVISEGMKKILLSHGGNLNIDIIYPWVDTDYIKPIKTKNWFVKKNNLQEKTIILYSGNMGKTHSLLTLLKAAKILNLKNKKFHFLFIGDGSEKEFLVKYVKTNDLQNVSFLPYQEKEVLPYSFASASYGVVSLSEGFESMSLPSKTFYYLSAGSAIISICKQGSDLESLVKYNGCGFSINPNNHSGLVNKLIKINDDNLLEFRKKSRSLSFKFTKANAREFI